MADLGDQIRTRRLALDLNQRDLAARAMTTRAVVSAVEAGTSLNLGTIEKLVSALGGDLSVTITWPTDPPK